MKVTNNSKYIKNGDIFIATKTNLLDRSIYINDAIKKHAKFIITDKNINKEKKYILNVENINKTYFNIYNNYYNRPYDNIKLIGVTGTDGKTTTSEIIKNLLNSFYKTAYLGTNGLDHDKHEKTINTTPDIKEILRIGNILNKENYKYLVMEASSEGLLLNRTDGLSYKVAILTNVTNDHLNVHKTKENYLKAKLILFKNIEKEGIAVLNIDDKNYNFFKKNIKNRIITYGQNKKANIKISDIKEYIDKTEFNLTIKNKRYFIKTKLLGIFNIYNLTCAITALLSLNINILDIIKELDKIKIPEGRMNFIDFKQNFYIVLDYAHTENATKEVLNFFNKVKKAKIITVVGCAGSRYKEKRKKIGKIVTDLSDIVIFTEDDPRFESPKTIINEMRQDVTKNNYIIEINRKKAIKKALKIAKKDDLVLILGKGKDNYLAIKNKYKKYNDYQIIKRYFTKVF